MSDRPLVQFLTADLRERAKSASGDFDALHQIYAETLYRSRKPARELREAVGAELAALQHYFPWPTTDAPEGSGRLDEAYFQYSKGLLGYMGYRVGSAGVSVYKRRALLDHVYKKPLPKVNSAEYMAEWGAPNSATRLRKMAESIASFTRSAKRNSAARYALAISEWESDLHYLKRSYYAVRNFKFQWPATAA